MMEVTVSAVRIRPRQSVVLKIPISEGICFGSFDLLNFKVQVADLTHGRLHIRASILAHYCK